MTRVALVSWEAARTGWRESLADFERRLSRVPGLLVKPVRWPQDGVVSLTAFSILVFAYPVESWFPRALRPEWVELLSKAGHLVGKPAYAVAGPGRFGAERTLVLLMNGLEAEGMRVRDFTPLWSPRQVDAFFDRLKRLEKLDV